MKTNDPWSCVSCEFSDARHSSLFYSREDTTKKMMRTVAAWDKILADETEDEEEEDANYNPTLLAEAMRAMTADKIPPGTLDAHNDLRDRLTSQHSERAASEEAAAPTVRAGQSPEAPPPSSSLASSHAPSANSHDSACATPSSATGDS